MKTPLRPLSLDCVFDTEPELPAVGDDLPVEFIRDGTCYRVNATVITVDPEGGTFTLQFRGEPEAAK